MTVEINKHWEAILLIGPTGSGKTPLGQLLELRGLKGKPCIHFDFGRIMRTFTDKSVHQVTQDEILIIRESLATGTLLEDKHFIIAKKLFFSFMTEQKPDEGMLVILNGLPRHINQAIAMEQFVDMQLLIIFECSPEVVVDRIRMNTGGDRGERTDDTPDEVKKRIDLFKQKTKPLLDYYRKFAIPEINVNVGVKSTVQDMHRQIENQHISW